MTHTGNYQRSGQARSLWHPSSSDLETGHGGVARPFMMVL